MVWSRFPFKTLVATGVLSFVLVDYPPLKVRLASDADMVKKAEFYPLSSFSMYSTFFRNPVSGLCDQRPGRKGRD